MGSAAAMDKDIAKRLAREEGLFVGTSSGAALAAAMTVAGKLDMAHRRLPGVTG